MATGRKTELPPGWATNPGGFLVRLKEGHMVPDCQWNVDGADGVTGPCGRSAPHARTLWNGALVFACGKHRRQMQEYAVPLVARRVGARGDEPAVMRPMEIWSPLYLDVIGAAEPVEHPVHLDMTGGACWCGATPEGDGWTGGKPTDP